MPRSESQTAPPDVRSRVVAALRSFNRPATASEMMAYGRPSLSSVKVADVVAELDSLVATGLVVTEVRRERFNAGSSLWVMRRYYWIGGTIT